MALRLSEGLGVTRADGVVGGVVTGNEDDGLGAQVEKRERATSLPQPTGFSCPEKPEEGSEVTTVRVQNCNQDLLQMTDGASNECLGGLLASNVRRVEVAGARRRAVQDFRREGIDQAIRGE